MVVQTLSHQKYRHYIVLKTASEPKFFIIFEYKYYKFLLNILCVT